MRRAPATALGILTIVVWSTLAALMTMAKGFPPVQLVAMCFVIAGVAGALISVARDRPLLPPRGQASAWAHGIGGLLGYNLLLMFAFHVAPPTPVNLINYLWPALLVVGCSIGRGRQAFLLGLLAATLGFGGVLTLLSSNTDAIRPEHVAGYLAALGAAVIWASYSLLGRRFAAVPTSAIPTFLLTGGIIASAIHFALEPTIIAAPPQAWLAVVLLGLGPQGLAFLTWDVGIKHGDVRLLGILSYAIPMLSMGLLVLIGAAPASVELLIGTLLVTLGGAVGFRMAVNARSEADPVNSRLQQDAL